MKIIIYNVNTQALEIFYRGENETMPYTYGTTMKVKEFRGIKFIKRFMVHHRSNGKLECYKMFF